MVTYTPVDYDPFAAEGSPAGAPAAAPQRMKIGGRDMTVTPVDYDPFGDVSTPDGMGAAFDQFADLPKPSGADRQRMSDLASAYHVAEPGRGMAVDQRVEQLRKDSDPYANATWQGLTFGFGDEIGAGLRTAFGKGNGYDENLAVERELLRRQRQERPIGMAGAEIVGAAIPSFLLPGAGAARTGEAATTAATKAPGFLDRTADAIGAGATYGGLYGFGTGEGGLESRLEEAGKGAAIGAVGAGVLSPVIEGVGAAGRAAWNAGKDYVAPFTQAGRERVASTTLRDAASDPAAALDALQNPNQNVPIVPGSRPTTFQETGDMGLGGLERAVETRRPEPFMQRRADQNQARVSALEGLQPDGSPEAVVSTLRQHLADIDRSTGEALEAATQSARNQTAALGGAGTPEGYGAAIRKQLDDVDQIRRQREGALWQAIDPDGTLALPADDIGGAARSIVQNKTRMSQPMEGNELGIFNDAATLHGVQPFREVADLRSRVSTAMRQELSQNGRTQVYARLSQLRGAIERNIENAVEARAAQEAQAVASGAMRQEDSVWARMEAALAAERGGWLEERARSVGADVNAGFGPAGAARAPAFSPAPRSQGQGRGGFSPAAGDQGIQGSASLTPNFDAEALARLRAANDFTKQTTPIYEAGPVGDVLARSSASGPFNLPVVAVPEKFFRRGSMGAEGMRALQAANNSPETAAAIRDYAVMSLRRVAEKADGTLDPGRVEAWRRAHADALRAIPEIDRMLADPVQASEAVTRLTAARKQALDSYQSGIVRQLIGVDNPADVTRTVGAIFNSRNPVTTMRSLADQVRGNPDATEGLRKAVADHITQRLRSNTEAATSGTTLLKSDQFQTFMRQNEPALREIFTPGEITTMKAIADDLQQANRSNTSVRLPGRSNSPQDLIAQMQQANAPQSWLSRVIQAGASIGAGTLATGGPWGGAAALLGTELLGALRRAGVQKIDDIVTEAMLDPELARKLLEKAPAVAPAVVRTVPRAAVPGAVMGVPAFKPEAPQRPLTSRDRLTQALMSSQRPVSKLSPTQQRLVDALAR